MNKYFYYWKIDDTNIIIGITECLAPIAVEITYEEYVNATNAKDAGKLFWIDKQDKLQFRDKLTKYDDATDTWIPDEDAIAADKAQQETNRQNQLKAQAKNELLEIDFMAIADTLAEYLEAEQSQILAYRKYLRDIFNGKTDLSTITELKTMEDF